MSSLRDSCSKEYCCRQTYPSLTMRDYSVTKCAPGKVQFSCLTAQVVFVYAVHRSCVQGSASLLHEVRYFCATFVVTLQYIVCIVRSTVHLLIFLSSIVWSSLV